MINRIHIFGAAGSGTTTIAKALCNNLKYIHFDTDNFFWEKTSPPFEIIRPIENRQSMLQEELEKTNKWVLSGSLCGWGDIFIPYFDLVVFVYLPKEIRMKRLTNREYERYGNSILNDDKVYKKSQEFIEWASKYDDSTEIGRNLQMHEKWFSEIICPKIKIENCGTIDESVNEILNVLSMK